MRHSGKDAKYVYLVGSLNGTAKSVHGYVPAVAITEGSNPDHTGMNFVPIDDFVNNTDFNQYLQMGKNQKLAREILKLFPNSKPDLALSKIAVYNYDQFNESIDAESDPISTKGYSDIKAFPTIQKWLYANRSASNTVKIAEIKKNCCLRPGTLPASGMHFLDTNWGFKSLITLPLTIRSMI